MEVLLLVSVVLADRLAKRAPSAAAAADSKQSGLVARCAAWLARYQPCFHPRSRVFRALSKTDAVLVDFAGKLAPSVSKASASADSVDSNTLRVSGKGAELNLDQLVQRQRALMSRLTTLWPTLPASSLQSRSASESKSASAVHWWQYAELKSSSAWQLFNPHQAAAAGAASSTASPPFEESKAKPAAAKKGQAKGGGKGGSKAEQGAAAAAPDDEESAPAVDDTDYPQFLPDVLVSQVLRVLRLLRANTRTVLERHATLAQLVRLLVILSLTLSAAGVRLPSARRRRDSASCSSS